MSGTRLTLLYVAFAVLATFANLLAQRIVLAIVEAPAGLVPAMVAGTGVGLVLKYLLDKRWIFDDRSTGLAAHGRRFGLYTAMGLVTTAVFWASETAFWWAFGTEAMREFGAVLGLAVGYAAKYRLDRRFVFGAPAASRA